MKLLDKENHIKILFEDNHLLIAEKPSPLLTQPTDKEKNSLEAYLKKYIKEKDNKQGNVYLQCIHRLDKNVSGIVVFAKSSKALKRLQQMQRKKQFDKKYIAVVHGHLFAKEKTLTNYLIHGNYKALISNEDDEFAKPAKLSYKVIRYGNETTVVEITLDTGRYHQIRAQFSHINHPIVGDKKYSSSLDYEKIMLHHKSISFMHPVTLKQMTIISPASFEKLDLMQFDKHLKQPL